MASYAEYVQDITEKAIRLGQAAGSYACPGMKNIGKPCTGKPYARFDEGGLVMVSMGWLLRHRQTKVAETDRPTPNAAGASSLLYPFTFLLLQFSSSIQYVAGTKVSVISALLNRPDEEDPIKAAPKVYEYVPAAVTASTPKPEAASSADVVPFTRTFP